MIRWPKLVEKPKPAENIDLDRPDMVREWYVFATKEQDEDEAIIHHGYNVAKAAVARLAADAKVINGHKVYRTVRIAGGGMVYPPPEEARRCQCKNDQRKQETCPCGHVGECHYPLPCAQADCRFLQTHDPANDADPLLGLIKMVDSDKPFRDELKVGDPGCLCSRCLLAFAAGEVPLVVQDVGGDVYRYHRGCLK